MNEVILTGYYDSGKHYGIQIRCTSVPDVLTNTSVVTVKVYLVHPYMNISARTGSVSIDGKAFSFRTAAIAASNKGLVATQTLKVTHADDGKREVSVAASFPYDLNSSNYGRIKTAKVSSKLTLDTIPRASEVVSMTQNLKPGTNDDKWTLTVSKHAEAFRHKAVLTLGEASIETDMFDTTVEARIPIEWLEQIPNSAEGTASVSIQTYSDEQGTTTIGDPVVTTFSVVVATTFAPNIEQGLVVLAPDNAGTQAAAINRYIQGFSRARATYDESKAEGQYGATIASIQIEHDGVRYDSVTDVLTKVGWNHMSCIVTDSRGLERALALRVSVDEYFPPNMSGISIYRCNAAGTADEEGTFLYFKADCSYADCGGANVLTIKAGYKPVGQSLWTNDTDIVSGEASILGAGALSTTTSYNARIIARDSLGNQASYMVVISTAEAALNLRNGGKGAAFGKYAEEDDLLDCDWRFRARGGIYGVSIYTGPETEHGAWNGSKVYQRVLTGDVVASTATSLGTIEGFTALVFAHGAAGNTALQSISVNESGEVFVTSLVSGAAHVIIAYTKEG